MIQKLSMFLLTVCCLYFPVQAQSWQWGKPISFDSVGINFSYSGFRQPTSTIFNSNGLIVASTTDKAGNIYSLLNVGKVNLKVAGQPDTAFGKVDILLTSFSCDGRYRWSQVIGSSADSDVALSIKASAESGVFVMGLLNMAAPGGAHFGKDTTIANTNKTMFLAKYDTAGNFQWVRLPQPDTLSKFSAWNLSQPISMDLSSDGTLYLLTCLSPGAYESGHYVVNNLSVHVLKYNSSGQFLGGIALPFYNLSTSPFPFVYNTWGQQIKYDEINNRFLIKGNSSVGGILNISGSTLGNLSYYVASFQATSGSLIWLQSSNPVRLTPATNSGLFINSTQEIDAKGNIYIAGYSQDSAFFNGVLFRNPWHSQSDFVMKMDANTGQALWTTVGRDVNHQNYINDLALTGQKLAITGFYRDSLIFPNALLTNSPSDTDDAFIVQLDAATGAVQKMASLTGTSSTGGSLITADRRGNFYVTGSYGLQGQAIGPDALTLNSYNNFFVAKWGWANCSCTPPVASLVHSASSNLAQAYTYTGTTAGLDSLVWDFGDGTTQKITSGFGNAVLHNFATTGHYTVCVTAYNESCGGSSTACIPLALSVGTTVLPGNIRVYPNPVSQQLNIEGATHATARVYDLLGRALMQVQIHSDKQVLELGSLPTGIYLLRITEQDGFSQSLRFSKQ